MRRVLLCLPLIALCADPAIAAPFGVGQLISQDGYIEWPPREARSDLDPVLFYIPRMLQLTNFHVTLDLVPVAPLLPSVAAASNGVPAFDNRALPASAALPTTSAAPSNLLDNFSALPPGLQIAPPFPWSMWELKLNVRPSTVTPQPVAAVPEPSTLLLLAAGASMMIRRRRKAARHLTA